MGPPLTTLHQAGPVPHARHGCEHVYHSMDSGRGKAKTRERQWSGQ